MATAKRTAQKDSQAWTNVSGSMIVFGKKFKGTKGTFLKFSTTIGRKFDSDDEFTNIFIDVQFPKDALPKGEGRHDINVLNGFLSVDRYVNKDGDEVTKPKVVIIDYEED